MAQFLNSSKTVEERLRIFLHEAASHPFEFGQWDCVITLANWLNVLVGQDPATDVRGTYSTIGGWKKVVANEGGMIRFIDGRAKKVGLEERKEPRTGDIGLMRIVREQGYWVGTIRGRRRWWYKVGDGITGIDLPTHKIWGL